MTDTIGIIVSEENHGEIGNVKVDGEDVRIVIRNDDDDVRGFLFDTIISVGDLDDDFVTDILEPMKALSDSTVDVSL